jgi:hypothetical protein
MIKIFLYYEIAIQSDFVWYYYGGATGRNRLLLNGRYF